MKRWLRITVAVALLLGMATVVWFVVQRPAPPVSGPIVLPDGSWVRIEAVTYGTNHLVGPPLSHVAERMPQPVRNFMVRHLGRRAAMRFSATTSSPKLVLWLNRGLTGAFPPGMGYMECVLSDTNGFASGESVDFAAFYPMELKEFDAFPRRAREITLTIYHHNATGAVYRCGSVVFANPVYRRYPEWQPEPLPSTKRVGDVEVTLEKLRAGHDDGGDRTVCSMRLRPLTNTNEVWQVARVETSDATGNKVVNTRLDGYADGMFTFAPALWPGEAWRLNCEIKRTTGFKPEEQFTFRAVPLGALNATNRVGWTSNCSGATVTLEQVVRRAPPADRSGWSARDASQVQLTLAGLTNGLQLHLLTARTDAGTNLSSGSWGGGETNRMYYFREIPTDARTADFTFAVQPGRRVEFVVKPEVGTANPEGKSPR